MLEQSLFLQELASILLTARKGKGITFEKLSELSSLDYSTLNLIENAKQNPRVYTMYKILYALDIDLLGLLQAKNKDREDRRHAILDTFKMLDLEMLENLNLFVKTFNISKK